MQGLLFVFSILGGMTGFEPATVGSTGRCSARLSYIPHVRAGLGTPGGTRTPSLWIRSPLLYPVELRAHAARELQRALAHTGADDGDRTRVFGLEGRCSTIELHPPVTRLF